MGMRKTIGSEEVFISAVARGFSEQDGTKEIRWLSGSADPSAVATDAPQGSLYHLLASPGGLFVKSDNGSSTNWARLMTQFRLQADDASFFDVNHGETFQINGAGGISTAITGSAILIDGSGFVPSLTLNDLTDVVTSVGAAPLQFVGWDNSDSTWKRVTFSFDDRYYSVASSSGGNPNSLNFGAVVSSQAHPKAVLGRQTAPPGSPATGDRYIIQPTGTGAWAGQDNYITYWTGASWNFSTPPDGCLVWREDTEAFWYFTAGTPSPTLNGTWQVLSTGGGGASTSASYVTTQAEAGLSAEFNLGGLTSGMLKHTVAGSVSTPATAVEGTDYWKPGGTDVALADGGTGASLSDPNVDSIPFWDDSAGGITWLQPDGTSIVISGTTISSVASFTETSSARFSGYGITSIYNSITATNLDPAGIGSRTVGIGYLSTLGKVLRLTFSGTIEADTTPQVHTLSIRLGTTQLCSTSIASNPSTKSKFFGQVDIIVSAVGGVGGTMDVYALGFIQNGTKIADFSSGDTLVNVSVISSQDLHFRAQNSVAETNGGVKLLDLTVEGIN